MSTAHRFFYALVPPPAVRQRLGAVRAEAGPLGRVVADDRLHLTLGITPDFPVFLGVVADLLCRLGEAVAAAPAEVRLDRLGASADAVAVRGGAAEAPLLALGSAIAALLAQAGLARPTWRFSPHLTLGYGAPAPFTRAIAPLGWRAEEFVLIHSEAGRTHHTPLGRWPLVGSQGDLFR